MNKLTIFMDLKSNENQTKTKAFLLLGLVVSMMPILLNDALAVPMKPLGDGRTCTGTIDLTCCKDGKDCYKCSLKTDSDGNLYWDCNPVQKNSAVIRNPATSNPTMGDDIVAEQPPKDPTFPRGIVNNEGMVNEQTEQPKLADENLRLSTPDSPINNENVKQETNPTTDAKPTTEPKVKQENKPTTTIKNE